MTAPAVVLSPPPPVVTAASAAPARPAPAATAAPAADKAQKPWGRHLELVPPADESRPPESVAPAAPPAAAIAPEPVRAPPPKIAPPQVPFDEALAQRWQSIVDGVRSRKKILGAVLEHARPVSLSGGELVIAFRAGEIFAKNVSDEKAALETVLNELLQAPTRIKVVELSTEESTAMASIADTNDRIAREAREARLRAGREHPAIARAASLLNAEIEDVRDLGGTS
jgi:hypothetical protein